MDKIEKQDTWYERPQSPYTILLAFPYEYIHLITEKISRTTRGL